MKKWKRFIAAILAAAISTAALASCGEKNEDTYKVLEEDLGSEVYAIGFRPDDVALAKEVQKILDEMVEDGTAAEISEKWFGTNLIINDQDYPADKEIASDDTSLEDLKERGKFIIGLDDSFPPMGFRDEENNIVGVDIELAAEVAERLGVEFEAQPINWDTKEMELENGNIDCIWNGMTVTDERKEAMFLSKPYLNNRQVVIVKESSGIETLADLEGKIVALQKGSSAEQALASSSIADKVTVQTYDENVTAFMDLQAGRADAFLVDEVVGNYLLANQEEQK
ncbi:MAG: transporter substrate-binding domain-containing protein [Candidatus Merdivicinus sp.]|jgi:ABC-type amino acid transport substrate-binding protein